MAMACLLLVPQRRCVSLRQQSLKQTQRTGSSRSVVTVFYSSRLRPVRKHNKKQELKTRYYSITAKAHTLLMALFGTVQLIIASTLSNSEYTPEMGLKPQLVSVVVVGGGIIQKCT